ncbi:ABC transporter substrate-binding protein [Oceanicella sp. SM1341]|uniref:ABC transporter substrate-binding protein n=1 Tax=Oceanicella sp. SM1341 TaxID=1548889 RepID=UPI000E514169|nr:ABC transporter substrate-binding protein [Oceanicella sp. SM1341]
MTKELEHLGRQVVRGTISRRHFMGRAAALGLTATSAGTLLGSVARAADPVMGGLLKAGMVGGESTNSLDPATFLSQVPFVFGQTWGEKIVEVGPTGELEPRIAEEWGASSDAKTWTFKMRDGVEFHNGKTVTAQDVFDTLDRHSNEASESGALGIMRGIDRMQVNGKELVISLKEANADLPYLLADYHLIIQPGGGKDAPDAGISAGPYKVTVNEPGVRHGGEKFANFWDAGNRGYADQVEITVINDATARTAALQSGQVHMINNVEPKIVDLIKRVPGVSVKNTAGRGHYVFIMHCDTAPFDNNDLRMALKLAINREDMVDKILRGYGTVGNDFPINSAYPLFPDDIEQRAYDPEEAAHYYKKSGHSGPIVLQTSDVAFPGAVDAAQLFQQHASAAGITLEVKREPGDGYWSEVWNKQPFCASYWGGRPVQDQMYSTAYISSADWNDTRFKRPEFDQLITKAKAELDEAKRKSMYHDAALMVRNEGGLILPMFNDWIEAVSDKVGGWEADGAQTMMNGYALSKTWLMG